MTFIASVIAKKGVALIADSLVTTSKAIISAEDFFEYLETKSASNPENVILNPKEIIDLFKHTTSHTKDYQEKLFEYDKFTGIACAGAARINKKQIEEIISELIAINSHDTSYTTKPLEQKVIDFCNYFESQVRKQLEDTDNFTGTSFIITNYDPFTKKTTIYRIDLKSTAKTQLNAADFKVSSYILVPDYEKVVCDGQNRISDRILYGELDTFMEIVPHIVGKIFSDFSITDASPEEYSENLMQNDILKNSKYLDDMKMYHLRELSLQQAVDLAYLLMKIEIDIQKYTKNIPTVGGVIKMAVIDDDKFRFIAGKNILTKETL